MGGHKLAMRRSHYAKARAGVPTVAVLFFSLPIVFADLAADADEFLPIGVGEVPEGIDGPGEPGGAEVAVDAFAVGGDGDIDFAFVVLIEFAANEGFVEAAATGLEGADDAGHLRGQDGDGALDFADGKWAGGTDEGIEGQKLRFGEFGLLLLGGEALAPAHDGEGEDFFGHLVE
jgi:hypothetical protein